MGVVSNPSTGAMSCGPKSWVDRRFFEMINPLKADWMFTNLQKLPGLGPGHLNAERVGFQIPT